MKHKHADFNALCNIDTETSVRSVTQTRRRLFDLKHKTRSRQFDLKHKHGDISSI